MDYTKSEIVITSQEEFDAIPIDYHGRIVIKFGSPENRALINRRFENAQAELRGNARAELWENAQAELWDNAQAVLRGNAQAVLRGNARAELWENARAELWENARAELWGYAQACIYSTENVQAHENARLIYPNENIDSFMIYHSIKHTKTKSVWYKAVHRKGDAYTADYDKSFIYEVGKTYEVEVNPDVYADCGRGVNMASLQWVLTFGQNWNDLAILEVEAEIKDIILPKGSEGKVRTRKAKVLREVPLEECGLYGKILAKRMEANNG